MKSEIQPPILLADGHDVFVYKDVNALTLDIEPASISAMDIVCMDSLGLRLLVSTDGKSIQVDAAESIPSGAREGIDIVKYYLDYCNIDFDRSASLEDLIDTVMSETRQRGHHG